MGSNPFSACRQGTGKSAGFGAGQSDPGGCLAGNFFTTAILVLDCLVEPMLDNSARRLVETEKDRQVPDMSDACPRALGSS
jgi:hypothetical protein